MKIEIRKFVTNELPYLKGLLQELGYPLEDDELQFNLDLVTGNGGIILFAEVMGISPDV